MARTAVLVTPSDKILSAPLDDRDPMRVLDREPGPSVLCSCCVSFGKHFSLSRPWFPHLSGQCHVEVRDEAVWRVCPSGALLCRSTWQAWGWQPHRAVLSQVSHCPVGLLHSQSHQSGFNPAKIHTYMLPFKGCSSGSPLTTPWSEAADTIRPQTPHPLAGVADAPVTVGPRMEYVS